MIFKITNSSHRTHFVNFTLPVVSNLGGLRDRSGKKEAKNLILKSRFTSLSEALKWQWNLKARREAKEINPHLIFTLLGT